RPAAEGRLAPRLALADARRDRPRPPRPAVGRGPRAAGPARRGDQAMSALQTIVLAAALAPQDGGGAAKRFLESLDRDGDVVVSRAEWKGSGAVFLQIDADRDGYLSLQELSHMNDKPAPPAPPPPPDPAEASR